VSVKPCGSQRLVIKIARAVTYQWLSGRGRGAVLSASDTLVVLGFKNKHLVAAPSRVNGLCWRPRAEIDSELKTMSDRILTLIGEMSK
jgi:hypothetical protein